MNPLTFDEKIFVEFFMGFIPALRKGVNSATQLKCHVRQQQLGINICTNVTKQRLGN